MMLRKAPKVFVWNHTVYGSESLRLALRRCAALIGVKGPTHVRVLPFQSLGCRGRSPMGEAHSGTPTLQWLSKGMYYERRGFRRGKQNGYFTINILVPYRAKTKWWRTAEAFVCFALHEFAHIRQYRTGQFGKLLKIEAKQGRPAWEDLAREKDAIRRKEEVCTKHQRAVSKTIDDLAEALREQYEVGYRL